MIAWKSTAGPLEVAEEPDLLAVDGRLATLPMR
jgi:hypothetical protein